MELEDSLPHLQKPATSPYPESDRSSPCHPTSLTSILKLSSHLRLGFRSGIFSSGVSTKIPYVPLLSPIRSKSPANYTLLVLITGMVFGS